MDLKTFIKVITKDTLDKADIIKRTKGKVIAINDTNVSIQLNTMAGAVTKTVTISNTTGMTVDVDDMVWIYYWRNINDGWILPANMKVSSKGVGEYINSDHTSERFNDYVGNTLTDFVTNDYVSLVGQSQKARGYNSSYSTIENVYMNGYNNSASLSTPIYASDSHFDYSSITGAGNTVSSQTITGTYIFGKDNTISLNRYTKCENHYVIGYNNMVYGAVRSISCFGKSNVASVGDMVSSGNHVMFFAEGGVLLPNATITKSKALFGDRPIISYQKQVTPNNIIIAFGGIVDQNDTARNNAMEVDYQGNLSVYGTVNGGGSDFAEYEEWADGNEENADRRGLFVVEDGDFIRLANADDDPEIILGAVSAVPTIIGGSNGICWKGTYKRDVFGSMLTDENDLMQSEEFDPSRNYVDRAHRQEFSPIAYVGKVVMVDDGTCEVNGYCRSADNGIATKSEQITRFRVRDRLDETHILVRIL